MASNFIVTCGCGRIFFSEAALEQHRRDKAISASSSIRPTLCARIKVSHPPNLAATEPSKAPNVRNPKDRWMVKGIGNVIDTLASNSLERSDLAPSISNSGQYDLICSYNWVNQKSPAVYVPGGAPIFEATSLPVTIKPDFGRHFIDQNTQKIPNYPFEVVFQAAGIMNPTVRFDEIDVLTNRNSLRKFFDFCKGSIQESFRVNLHLVHNTLIIERCVKSTAEFLNGSKDSGFGHNFEKTMTRLPQGLENSSGHHRVLRYDFGGLKCAVRFEVDAAYDQPDTFGENEHQTSESKPDDKGTLSLATALSSMALTEIGSDSTGGSANTIRRGKGTEQTSVAELKSRKDRHLKPKPHWLPQLWLGRTRYLITGHHENGTFNEVHVHDLQERLETWESNGTNQEALQKMVVLLSRLREVVRANEAKPCVVLCEKSVKPPTLRIHASMSRKGPLPTSVVKEFWSTLEN